MTSFKSASLLAASLLALGAALCAPAAHADPVTRAAVADTLGGFEQAPDLAVVRGWGAPGAAHLMAIANDAAAPLHVRVRAAHALRAYGNIGPVRSFLRALAAVPAQNLFLLRASLDALVEGFNDVPEVARHLHDVRADVRDGAAWALAASHDPAARAALAARLQVETDPTVRLTLTTALQGASPVPAAPAPQGVTAHSAATRPVVRAQGR